jgi:transcriptional regulator with XRE-family HTH domain
MTKGPILQKMWDDLPENRKKNIKNRAAQKIKEYRTLQEIRKMADLTQSKVAKELNMPQSNVSRLEKNSDMLLSTLQGYIEAIGGKLNLTVELPNTPPIVLTGLGDLMASQSEGQPFNK